ncbi:hypothetical protein [[Clostridium] polysaccharolyticum]|uniref:Uncharacterized protein n=1 Tax=[Clostridium] polysaccharolyticum TaxID=29364 RepID=A0A1I0DDG3_9FIRM|nr:hypothetical protein [[Clostridium] polysaccharolyticum]SET30353.1 hypothetical protein SAMN04487772_11417 [[Clostridium] polysaccharolyticum]
MDQLDGRRNNGRGQDNGRGPSRPQPPRPRPPRPEPPRPPRPEPPRPRPPRPEPPRPPRPEPPRPPRPIPLPIPQPVENIMAVDNALIIDVDITPQFSTVTIVYEVRNFVNQASSQTVRLVITDETQIVSQFGQRIGVWGLREGMLINARFSSRFTRSLPPQAEAFWIRIIRF